MTAMKIGMEAVLSLQRSEQLSCYDNLFRLVRRLYLFQKKASLFAGFFRCLPCLNYHSVAIHPKRFPFRLYALADQRSLMSIEG